MRLLSLELGYLQRRRVVVGIADRHEHEVVEVIGFRSKIW